MNNIFPQWPSYSDEEIAGVQKVLTSNKVNYWTGQECKLFEKEFANWLGVKYAVSLANGTVALDLALKALNIKSGDEVIVTPRSFIASASCVLNSGANPVFVDVDRDSGNINAKCIELGLSAKTKAIICVHLGGWPCEMDEIMELANRHNLMVIEDCAQAHGGVYKGRKVGSIGHIAAWSFCQDKIMTTGGEGGMVTTNDYLLWKSMWSFKDHGKNYESVNQSIPSTGFRWLHDSIGTNWRMMEMQATIGRIQLKKIKNWTEIRNENAKILSTALEGLESVRLPTKICHSCENDRQNLYCNNHQDRGCTNAFYRYYIYLNLEKLSSLWSREQIIEELNRSGIPCGTGTCPEIYLENAFNDLSCRPSERFLVARELGETSIAFLVHPGIDKEKMESMALTARKIIMDASK